MRRALGCGSIAEAEARSAPQPRSEQHTAAWPSMSSVPPSLITHHPPFIMADEAFLLSSSSVTSSSSGLTSARAVSYAGQKRQVGRLALTTPAVGLTVYDVSAVIFLGV